MLDTFTIQESRETTLQLTSEQAEALRALGRELRGRAEFRGARTEDDGAENDGDEEDSSERTVIRCSSDGDGKYRVRVANAIGAVAIPGATLHVVPKIPVSHFAYLARKAYSSARISQESVSVDSLDVFWELVAQWCVAEVEHLVRFGLLVDYKTFTEDLGVVRGRADVRATTQNFLRGRLEANCTFDELDIDHPLNRVLRAAVRTIAGSGSISNDDLKRRASRLDRAMDGIGALQHGDLQTVLDRRTQRYADAFDLSRRVLGLVGTNVVSGNRFGRTFLIPTPGLVEDAIRRILEKVLAPVKVTKVGRSVPGDVYFSVNPDLVFAGGHVTGDVKYKVASGKWNRADVQQAAMFATGFHARAAMIATFSIDPAVGDLHMVLGALDIQRITWLATDEVAPEDSENDFADRVRQFMAGKLPLAVVA